MTSRPQFKIRTKKANDIIISENGEETSLFMDLCRSDIDEMFKERRANALVLGTLEVLKREGSLSQRVHR